MRGQFSLLHSYSDLLKLLAKVQVAVWTPVSSGIFQRPHTPVLMGEMFFKSTCRDLGAHVPLIFIAMVSVSAALLIAELSDRMKAPIKSTVLLYKMTDLPLAEMAKLYRMWKCQL